MGSLTNLYQRIQFCKRFGATWNDRVTLIKLTLDYSLSIRSKSKRLALQDDQEIKSIHVKFNGHQFPLYFRRQDLSMLYEVWMDKSYDVNPKNINDGIVLDLGAHVGFTTLYLWTLLGDSRSYICIEGSSKNAIILKKNLQNIPDASLIESIVTSDGRKVNFYDEVSGHLHQVHNSLGKLQNSVAVAELLSSYSDQSIAICKMDVEGMEFELLTQNNHWLSQVLLIYIEIHDHGKLDSLKLKMKKIGFSCLSQQEIVIFNRVSSLNE